MRNRRVLLGDELELAAMRQVGHADAVADLQAADIHVDVRGNIPGQALDLDFAQPLLPHATLVLHTGRYAVQHHGHLHQHGLVHGDALQVDVQQVALDRLILPVDDHGLHPRAALHVHVEDGVVAGLRVQDAQYLLGVELDGDRGLLGPVDHAGNLAGHAHAPRRILVELALAGRC